MINQSEPDLSHEYRILYPVEKHDMWVLLHEPTHTLVLWKQRKNYDIHVYQYLKEHPHPNIPSIRSYEETENGLIVLEEYIEGKTLKEIIETAESSPDTAQSLRILDAVCDGLSFLHSATPPIIHRDLKASNIILTETGLIKLIDYDAAKTFKEERSEDTVHIGTPGIAAPEQYGFAQSDARTDIYALGKLTEQLLGRDPQYSKVIRKATEIDPRNRYQNVREFRSALHGSHAAKDIRPVLRYLPALLLLLLIPGAWLLGRESRPAGTVEDVTVEGASDATSDLLTDNALATDSISGDSVSEELLSDNDSETTVSVSENTDILPTETGSEESEAASSEESNILGVESGFEDSEAASSGENDRLDTETGSENSELSSEEESDTLSAENDTENGDTVSAEENDTHASENSSDDNNTLTTVNNNTVSDINNTGADNSLSAENSYSNNNQLSLDNNYNSNYPVSTENGNDNMYTSSENIGIGNNIITTADGSQIVLADPVTDTYNIFPYWEIHFLVPILYDSDYDTRIGHAFSSTNRAGTLGFLTKQDYFSGGYHTLSESEVQQIALDWVGSPVNLTVNSYSPVTIAGYQGTRINATHTTDSGRREYYRIAVFYDASAGRTRVIHMSWDDNAGSYPFDSMFDKLLQSAYL